MAVTTTENINEIEPVKEEIKVPETELTDAEKEQAEKPVLDYATEGKRIGTGKIWHHGGRRFRVIEEIGGGKYKAVAEADIAATMNRIVNEPDRKHYEKKYGKQWKEQAMEGQLPAEWEKELPIVTMNQFDSDEEKKKRN